MNKYVNEHNNDLLNQCVDFFSKCPLKEYTSFPRIIEEVTKANPNQEIGDIWTFFKAFMKECRLRHIIIQFYYRHGEMVDPPYDQLFCRLDKRELDDIDKIVIKMIRRLDKLNDREKTTFKELLIKVVGKEEAIRIIESDELYKYVYTFNKKADAKRKYNVGPLFYPSPDSKKFVNQEIEKVENRYWKEGVRHC